MLGVAGKHVAAVLWDHRPVFEARSEVAAADVEPVGCRDAIDPRRTIGDDRERTAIGVGALSIVDGITVIALARDDQIALAAAEIVQRNALEIVLERGITLEIGRASCWGRVCQYV